MFEMLTGRVPYNGETTVAIAIKHIQEPMPSPRDFVPEIPYSLEDIVLKCCEKSPDRRYQNMQELVEDLKQCLLTPDEDFVVRNGIENEGTRSVTDEEMEEIKSRTSDYDNYYPEDDGYDDSNDRYDDSHMRLADDEYYGDDEDDYSGRGRDYDGPSTGEKVTTILSILAGIVIVLIIIFLALKIIGKRMENSDAGSEGGSSIVINDSNEGTTTEPVEVTMPSVVGSDIESARNALSVLGLNAIINFQESDTIPSGTVISCDVEAGTTLISGSNVGILVSSGTDSVEMPDVIGKPINEAKLTLELSGFTVNAEEASSDEVPQGYVISTNPEPGVMAAKGVSVTITISVGATDVKVKIPRLIGQDEAEATMLCIENNLSIGHITYVPSDTIAEGLVCSQSLSEGSFASEGSIIDFEVSTGPEKHTYKCNLSVSAPSSSEAPDYISGTEVRMRLVGSDGKVLLDQTTREFPYTANFYGIGCPSGILTITYTVTTESTTTTDADGNTVTTPGTTVERSFTREIGFIQEDA
jgi:serine/threonine-protein kinase